MTPSGYWSEFGRAASVDWCEPNYVHSHFVAEWWNAITSVALIGLGVAGLVHARRLAGRLERRFVLLFLTLCLVGVGSTAFHGTLLRAAQALDELPMLYTALIASYALRFRTAPSGPLDRQRRRWQLALLASAVLFTVVYFALKSYFVLFIVSYALLVATINLVTLRFALLESAQLPRKLCVWAICCHTLCFFGLWVPEHLLLSCSHPLQALELHALYHLGAGFATYTWMLGLVIDRRGRRDSVPAPHIGAAVASQYRAVTTLIGRS